MKKIAFFLFLAMTLCSRYVIAEPTKYKEGRLEIVNEIGKTMEIHLRPYTDAKEIFHLDSGDSKMINLQLPIEDKFTKEINTIVIYVYTHNGNLPCWEFELKATFDEEGNWHFKVIKHKILISCHGPETQRWLELYNVKETLDGEGKPVYTLVVNEQLRRDELWTPGMGVITEHTPTRLPHWMDIADELEEKFGPLENNLPAEGDDDDDEELPKSDGQVQCYYWIPKSKNERGHWSLDPKDKARCTCFYFPEGNDSGHEGYWSPEDNHAWPHDPHWVNVAEG